LLPGEHDAAALPTLIDLYPEADRPTKITILEAIGKVKDERVVSFLMERLQEPSQTLRLVAACMVIQALNR